MVSTQKRKILYVEQNVDGTIGGSYYSLLFLIKGLDKNIYSPIVIFYHNHSLVEDFREAGAVTHIFHKKKPISLIGGAVHSTAAMKPLRYLLKTLQMAINFFRGFILAGIEAALFIRKNKIDLVHLNNSILYNHHWMLGAMLSRAKCITHERGINEKFPFTARFLARRLHAVICISNAVQENLFQKTGLTNSLIIYNGLDPAAMKVTMTSEEIRKTYSIAPVSPVIGIVGNIKSWKGQSVVIRAVADVKRTFEGIKCFLVGTTSPADKPYAEEVRRLVSELNLNDSIIFAGFQKNVANYINAMDIVIHASILPEPFGRVILEAIALKKPIIATNIGAPLEIILEGRTGLLTPPGDHEELANAIIKLLQNNEMRKKMGEDAYGRLMTEFDIRRNIELTEGLYNRAIQGTQ